MSLFGLLSLPTDLTLSEDQLKAAYDESPQEEQHLQARNSLLIPSIRLEQWMQSRGFAKTRHSSIPNEFIALFSHISGCVTRISQLSEKKKSASSLLGQTLLDKQLFEQKPNLDILATKLDALKAERLAEFHILQDTPSSDHANRLLQGLKFIQKWESELNKAYTNLL